MHVEIRPVTLELAGAYRDCLESVAQERQHIAMLEAPPLYLIRAYLMENLQAGNPLFVACAGEVIVGWCDLLRDPMPSYAHNGSLGMGVLAAYRRQGVGQRLLETCLKQAKSQGFKRIELQVMASNQAAQQLYLKWGFEQEGRLRKRLYLNGEYQDILQMVLIFT